MKYEDLTRIMEEEKKNALSKILPGFYSTVNEYIKELETADRNIYKRHSEEAVLIQYEMKNALATIDKIFKKRTRKIINIASARAFSKTPENTTHDIEHMTPQEQEVYHQMRNAIMKYKEASVDPILGNDDRTVSGIAPRTRNGGVNSPVSDTDIPQASEINDPTASCQNADIPEPGEIEVNATVIPDEDVRLSEVPANTGIALEEIGKMEVPEPLIPNYPLPAQDEAPEGYKEPGNQESVELGKNDINKEYIVVRLLKDIPEFMGADGNRYNPGADDVAVLPKVNARALIKRKVAVQIESP
ncbi:MAG: hypothetical protein M8352_09135 [ANME-2 cluster archaeon]|nr:hypothetical protein [ANME-2 cluster archaeon]